MKYVDYERAFSPARLSKYSYACGAGFDVLPDVIINKILLL